MHTLCQMLIRLRRRFLKLLYATIVNIRWWYSGNFAKIFILLQIETFLFFSFSLFLSHTLLIHSFIFFHTSHSLFCFCYSNNLSCAPIRAALERVREERMTFWQFQLPTPTGLNALIAYLTKKYMKNIKARPT